MKTIVSLFLAVAASASAFTLDFVGLTGTTLPPNPLVVNVAGYGNVQFAAGYASNLEVGNTYQNDSGNLTPSLQLGASESVVITFLGANPTNVDFDFVGYSFGDNPSIYQLGANSFLVGLSSGDGLGIQSISFNAVPEVSTSLLSAIGVAGFALRRRR